MLFYKNKNESTALLYLLSAVPLLEEIAIESLDDYGYFKINMFEERTRNLDGNNYVFSRLIVTLFNNKKDFPLDILATLSDHHLNIAFEVIRNFKNIQQKNLENIKIKPLIYLNQAEVAEMLQQNDINMDRRKVNVYYKRGHLPSPEIYVGNHPGWREATMKKWIEDYKAGKVLERRI